MSATTDALPISGLNFIKGEPVHNLERGKVYVLEFWATWCPPCRQSIPHLTELQHKYSDVVIIGVTSEQPSQVRKFVQSMGQQMDYRVATDDMGSAQAYMEKFHVGGIPHSFVIDANLKIRWHGHPMEPAFETTLSQCITEARQQQQRPKINPKGMTKQQLMDLPVKDLKQILVDQRIASAGLPEKSDLADAILTHFQLQ